MRIISVLVFFVYVSVAGAQDVSADLRGSGLEVEVHGASVDSGHIVGGVAVYDSIVPQYDYYSLTTQDPEVAHQFKGLKRHDRLRVWGELDTENRSQQKHLIISRVVVETPSDIELPDFHRKADFPASFPTEDQSFKALVHAIYLEKQILVVEYKDMVLPVQVPPSITLPDLYKNDLVEIKAKIARHPENPKHLRLIEISQKDALVDLHGQTFEKSGALVRFPKSPQVRFDVYAIQDDLGDGLSRQFTILNFENPELFHQIREKFESYWKAGDQSKIENGRNKMINRSLIVKAKGIANMVHRGQANPQIIVNDINDIEWVSGLEQKR